MKLYTSNFTRRGSDEKAVAISCGVARWFHGRRYPQLAPERWMLHGLTDEAYTKEYYARILSRLNAEDVVRDLGDGAILLCWEKPGEFCHRQLVAEWLRANTGIEIEEWQPEAKPEPAPEAAQIELFK